MTSAFFEPSFCHTRRTQDSFLACPPQRTRIHGTPRTPRTRQLVRHMSSGVCHALVLCKPAAIEAWRKLMGPADPEVARKVRYGALRTTAQRSSQPASHAASYKAKRENELGGTEEWNGAGGVEQGWLKIRSPRDKCVPIALRCVASQGKPRSLRALYGKDRVRNALEG